MVEQLQNILTFRYLSRWLNLIAAFNTDIRNFISLGRWHNFFLKHSQSIAHLVEILNTFSLFSRLKQSLTKYETEELRARKRFQVVVCGRKFIDLGNEAVKIVGISETTTE